MSNKPLPVDQALVKARSLAGKGDPDQAMRIYRAVLEKFPGNKRAIDGLKALNRPRPDRGQIGRDTGPSQEQIAGLMALYRQRRLQEALEQGTALAERYPDMPLILNILGAVNADTGRLDEAVTVYTRALRLKPDYAEAHNNLGNVLKALGRHDEAIASYTKALGLKPGYAEARNNLGNALGALGRHQEAIASYTKALRLKPDFAEAHGNLGMALNDLGEHEEAIAALAKALRLKPDLAEAHNSLGIALKAVGRHDEAIASYTRALRLKPGFAEAHNGLGNALKAVGRHDEAIASYTGALRLKPDFAEAHNNLGNTLMTLGQHDEAIASLTTALRLKPDFANAYYNLGKIKKYEIGDPRVARMLELVAHPPIGGNDKILLGFALGKAYGDLGDAERSFEHFQAANRLRKRALGYDIASDRTLFGQIESIFGADDLPTVDEIQPVPEGKKRPVFIVGMLRSGTTLIEQILASHSQVHGAGELKFLDMSVLPVLDEIKEVHGGKLTVTALEGIRCGYLTELGNLGSDKPCITDKMPLNFRFIGFMLTALPEAKIINLQRDPVATCWSIFTHYFSSKGNGYAYDLVDVAEYYKMYIGLMDFWRERFPNRFYDLDYEALTENQQEETRKLIEYCGLGWEDRCLEFHKTKRAVKTASSAQVRQAMYQGSSEAWRKYEAHLEPMLQVLEG